jgi:hypothetical protein
LLLIASRFARTREASSLWRVPVTVTKEQRESSGRLAVLSPTELSETWEFRREQDAARCYFLRRQRKQRERLGGGL